MKRALPKPSIDVFSLLRHEDNRIGTYDRVGALLYDIDNFRKGKSPGPGEYFVSGISRPPRDIMTRQELKDAQVRYILKPAKSGQNSGSGVVRANSLQVRSARHNAFHETVQQ